LFVAESQQVRSFDRQYIDFQENPRSKQELGSTYSGRSMSSPMSFQKIGLKVPTLPVEALGFGMGDRLRNICFFPDATFLYFKYIWLTILK
jgi:hypothetical protein